MKKLTPEHEQFLLRRQHRLEEEKYLETRRQDHERERKVVRKRPRSPSVPLRLLSGRDRKHVPKSIRTDPVPHIAIPATFSFIKNPKESIRVIRELASCRGSHLRGVFFDHSAAKDLDLAAECALDIVAIELRRENRGRALALRGDFPSDERARRFIQAVGIVKNLSVLQHYLPEEQEKKLKIFRMRTRRQSTSLPMYKGQVLKEFVDYINECASEHGYSLGFPRIPGHYPKLGLAFSN